MTNHGERVHLKLSGERCREIKKWRVYRWLLSWEIWKQNC